MQELHHRLRILIRATGVDHVAVWGLPHIWHGKRDGRPTRETLTADLIHVHTLLAWHLIVACGGLLIRSQSVQLTIHQDPCFQKHLLETPNGEHGILRP